MAWDDKPFLRSYMSEPRGPGLSVDRSSFDACLRDAARKEGVRIETGVARDVEVHPRHVRVHSGGEDRLEIRASYVVDATGRRATIARKLGAQRTQRIPLIAWIAEFETADLGALVVEASPDGWFYTMGTDGGASVGWVTEPGRVHPRSAERELRAALVNAPLTRECVGDASIVGMTKKMAGSGLLDRVIGDRWIAVGDAAAYTDPIWGQGVSRALEVAERASEYLRAPAKARKRLQPLYASAIAEHWLEVERGRDEFYARGLNRFDTGFWRYYDQQARANPLQASVHER